MYYVANVQQPEGMQRILKACFPVSSGMAMLTVVIKKVKDDKTT